MALTAAEIIALAFQGVTNTAEAIAFEKTIPADVTGLERELRIAEFVFPKVIALIRQVIAGVQS